MTLPTGNSGKALALGICGLLLLLFYFIAVEPLIVLYADGQQELHQRSALAERLQRAVHDLPRLRELAQKVNEGSGDTDLLTGSSDAVAAAALQSTVKGMVVEGGATLNSAEILPAEPHEKYQRVAIRVSFTADLELLTQVLRGIETAHPQLFVDNLDIRSGGAGGADDASPTLTISVDVYGFRSL